jgi:hypothetical protein
MTVLDESQVDYIEVGGKYYPKPLWGDLIDPNKPELGKYMPLHSKQWEALNHPPKTRFVGAVAGTGGGKTVLGPIWCIKQIEKAIAKYGRVTGMIIAPTYKVLARATMPALVDCFKYTQYEGEYKESKSQYVLPHGWGVIWCQGADNPGGLEGGQFDFVWGDEGGQFKAKTFEAITGRTGHKQSPILITTTPYGLGPLYTEWYTRFVQGDQDYFFVIWDSIENPGYSKEEFERARRRLTPEKFAERYRGQFMKPMGLVYPEFHKCIIQMDKQRLEELLSSKGWFIGGMDFGWNDPFCALGGFLTPDDVLYIWYERYKSQTILEDHANNLPTPDKGIIWFADHNPGAIRKLKKGGHNTRPAKKFARGSSRTPIINGIIMVNARIQLGKLKVISNRCPATVEESNLYVYPDKDEEIFGDIPVDKDNHAMDALRYLVMSIDHKKAV